jgi:hypothetical protein
MVLFRVFSIGLSLLCLVAPLACVDGGNGNECECFICESAVALAVIDKDTQEGITNFSVELIWNGTPLGEPFRCQDRAEDSSTCSFGEEPGIYHVIVQAPGYETREGLVRVADEGDSEICCAACLAAKVLRLELERPGA